MFQLVLIQPDGFHDYAIVCTQYSSRWSLTVSNHNNKLASWLEMLVFPSDHNYLCHYKSKSTARQG